MLNQILQHSEMFVLSTAPGADRMIQIPPPTQKDRLGARRMVEAFGERLAE